jgi:hypothetical protein
MKRPQAHYATNIELRMEYLMDACYSFLRAEGPGENLISALRRARADTVRRRLEDRGAELPSPEEVRARAVDRFGEERLHKREPE